MRRFATDWLFGLCLFVTFVQSGFAQQFSVLYDFGSGGDQDPVQPSYPGIIAQGEDGNLYSTAPYTVNNGGGALFLITPSTGNLSVIDDLGNSSVGYNPFSGLILATDGNFYGTASSGGDHGYGTILQRTPYGLNALWSFTGQTDQGEPYAPPIQAIDGNLYGTTAGNTYGQPTYGTVYRIGFSGLMKVLYTFDQQHGSSPYAPLAQAEDGTFYGVTEKGGNLNLGTVFSITPKGAFKVLYNFDGTHGAQPYGPLAEGNDGNFYGTAFTGGSHKSGVIFRITPSGQLKVVHEFAGSSGGYYPVGGLVLASDGNYYGTTRSGGRADAGTIFKFTPQGKYTVLYQFHGYDGEYPLVTLTQHTNGLLYGDTEQGGVVSNYCHQTCGVFFSLNVGLQPFVSLVPWASRPGTNVGILGQGFSGTTSVLFHGRPASFRVVSDTFITATVPHKAKTGFVSVTTPGGTLKSNRQFQVIR